MTAWVFLIDTRHEAVFGVFHITHKQCEIIWSEITRRERRHLIFVGNFTEQEITDNTEQ